MVAFPSQLLLSTKHRKEQILQHLFEPLGTALFTPEGFDTDTFGTFCGKTPRIDGPKATVKEKCLAGMRYAQQRQGLASEGSFGPHPQIPLLTVNEEWLIYIDLDLGLEIYGRSTSLDVCDQHLSYQAVDELDSFLERIEFGAQGLVFKDKLNDEIIDKGITDRKRLLELIEKHHQWHIATDLRAHLNPTRQKNIIEAGVDLIKRMHSWCPKCQQPDFSVKKYSGHLHCSWCGRPTDHHANEIYSCLACNYEESKMRSDLTELDPQFCPHCNP